MVGWSWRAGAVAVALGLGAPAWGQSFDLSFDVDRAKAQQLGMDPDRLERDLDAMVDQHLRLRDLDGFLESMARAAAVSTRGMGADYGSNPQRFVLGGGVGSGVNSAGLTFGKGQEALPPGGFAAQVSFLAGVNLGGILGAKEGSAGRRFLLYANGLAMPLPSSREIGGTMYNAGAHLQVLLVDRVNAGVASWGGLALTAGYERSHYALRLRKELPLSAPISGGEATWTALGDYRITATSDAIPIELSTNVRLLAVTVWMGGALDVGFGESNAFAALNGPVKGKVGGRSEAMGTGSLALSAGQPFEDVVPRLFLGAQLNVLMLKAYGHLNLASDGSVGGHVGARIAL